MLWLWRCDRKQAPLAVPWPFSLLRLKENKTKFNNLVRARNIREIEHIAKYGTKEPTSHQSKYATPQIQRSHTASTKLSAKTKIKELHRQTNI